MIHVLRITPSVTFFAVQGSSRHGRMTGIQEVSGVDGPGLKAVFLSGHFRAESRGFYRRAAGAAPEAWMTCLPSNGRLTGNSHIWCGAGLG